MRTRTVLAAVADAACIVTFAAVGRSSHAGADAVLDVLRVAWPFLTAGALTWVVTRAWRDPVPMWPVGVGIWAGTWGVGMLLRGLSGGGLAPTFLLVAATALAALLLGWRGIVALVSATRGARSPRGSAQPGSAGRSAQPGSAGR
ncbi:DUF3054 domain-containing protein [Pengzhenrongella frigida]|uniref:DUF3054 domain-containing protein n=1 Tax=Pengzhenrongella frigida TaxID=1259133 RepID=A0A4V1ZHK3_9MICO|nr:DUF3054 domain-containing protein [Cellulomonas sp. HLT2-17]RYV52344.1 DUF3054 domain-containing protein [Cellulomonas sp. HLT2-17]